VLFGSEKVEEGHMTDFNPLSDQNQTPEDVATLYSWANLHGAKYRDFSASRAQTREIARVRAEQSGDELQERIQGEADAAKAAEAQRATEEAQAAEQALQAQLAADQSRLAAEEAERTAQQAAEQAAQTAARQAAEEAAQRAAQRAAEEAARYEAEQNAMKAARQAAEEAAERAAEQAAQRAQDLAAQVAAQQAAQAVADRVAEQAARQFAQQHAWQPPRTDPFPAPPIPTPPAPYAPQQAQNFEHPGFSRPQAYRPTPASQQYGPTREEWLREERAREEGPMFRNPWAAPEVREPASRPAWLNTETPEPAPSVPPASAPPADETLQGSRDRLTSRWFALRGVFDGIPAPVEPAPLPVASRAPAMAVFSLAGGVGKTSIVATLGRALSARGERVLLVDTAAFGLLPFFFGATDQRPGQLRTFTPPGASSDVPIQMVTIDAEGLSSEPSSQESLSGEIAKFARGAGRVIVDLATASGATTRRIMRMSPMILVPVVPDMNSVVSVSSIDAFFEQNNGASGKPFLPYYVLNQFDASLPLHLDVREVLREQLGERLLSFALRRAPAMSEALAEGMTVMDYAPGSTLAEDFVSLAAWVKSLSAPATTSYRGVRWSER
jgi:cellulose synthase operon protein YhjQ